MKFHKYPFTVSPFITYGQISMWQGKQTHFFFVTCLCEQAKSVLSFDRDTAEGKPQNADILKSVYKCVPRTCVLMF